MFVFGFSGYTESLDDSIEVAVPQDDYGLYAIDILDPSFVSLVVLSKLFLLLSLSASHCTPPVLCFEAPFVVSFYLFIYFNANAMSIKNQT